MQENKKSNGIYSKNSRRIFRMAIKEKYKKHILTEDLEIHIIMLPKIKKLTPQESKEELVKWLNFIEEPESEKVKICIIQKN